MGKSYIAENKNDMKLDIDFNHSSNGAVDPDDFCIYWKIVDDCNFVIKQIKIAIFDVACDKKAILEKILSGSNYYCRFLNSGLEKKKLYCANISVICENNDIFSFEKKFITSTDFKNAKWIADADNNNNVTAYYTDFHKSFFMKDSPKTAVLYVSFQLYGKIFLNDNLLTGYVTPAPSNIKNDKYYLCYDVTNLIKTGENTVFSQLYYINADGQNFETGRPGFIFELDFYYENGDYEEIVSDEEWDCSSDTVYLNNMPFVHGRNLATVQYYDNTRIPFKNGKHKSKLSDDLLQNCQMSPQQIPEGTILERLSPVEICSDDDNIRVFDAGRIISGWVCLDVNVDKQQEITVRYSEKLDEAGRIEHKVANVCSDFYYDAFKLQLGNNLLQCDGMYKTFRFFEISGLDKNAIINQIQVIRAGNLQKRTGEFRCSNELLNKIFDACILTQENNTINGLVDCPHREQSQYIADSNLQAENLIYNFEAYSFLKKVLDDFSFAQYDDGTFPYIYPATYTDKVLKIPEWDLYYIELLYKTYYHFGDIELLSKHYSTCQRVADNIISKFDSNDLVLCNNDWHIDDWPYPKTTGERLKHRTVENVLSYNNLFLLSKIAKILNKSDDSKRYLKFAQKLRKSIVSVLFDEQSGFFIDGSGTEHISQCVNVAAVYYGILPKKQKKSLIDKISSQTLECSVVMTNKLLKVLFENGYGNRAYEILSSENYPGWGYMIKKGYKTVWEGFDDKESHTHAWNGYPARIMQEFICGISYNGITDEAKISPYYAKSLEYAFASVSTPHGKIYSKWERAGNEILLSVKAPSGMKICVSEFNDVSKCRIYNNKNSKWKTFKWKE